VLPCRAFVGLERDLLSVTALEGAMAHSWLAVLCVTWTVGCGGSVAGSEQPPPPGAAGGASTTGATTVATTGATTIATTGSSVTTSTSGVGGAAGGFDPPQSRPEAGPPMPIESGPEGGGVTGPILYRLHLVARYSAAIVNATGIACDGDRVWLIGGGHNAPTHTLAHVDYRSGAIDATYTYSNLIEQLGTGVYGITKLNGFVFVSVAGATNKIVRIDPLTGKIVQQFGAPTDLGPSDLDVSSSGQLVESSGTGDVFTLDPRTGAVLARFSAGDHGRDDGIAIRGNEAFVGDLFGGMAAYDFSTGAILGRVTKEDGSQLEQQNDVGPMCFNGANLFILSKLGISAYEVVAAGR
jgi:hypothetical protein